MLVSHPATTPMKAIASPINTTRYNWKPVVASFLLHMQERGFRPVAVDNGDGFCQAEILTLTGEEACACDEATVYFRSIQHPEDKAFPAYLVLGNSPHELVADYACRDTETGKAFDAAITDWSNSMQGTACPHEGMTAWHYLRMAQACMVAEGVTVPPQLAADVLAGM